MILTPMGRMGWDPLADFRRLQNDMNRALAGYEARRPANGEFPRLNLWVSEQSAVVTAELPGVTSEDIEITVHNEILTIQGKVDPPAEGEKVAWHRRERSYGSFARSIELPFRVDPENVQARFRHGVLEVELNRPAADKPRKVAISNS